VAADVVATAAAVAVDAAASAAADAAATVAAVAVAAIAATAIATKPIGPFASQTTTAPTIHDRGRCLILPLRSSLHR
jgi:hypothetical protein